MISQRKKTFAKRSRTGCRTCRFRRIKCDETPGTCTNCTSAGWKCEGYEISRPVIRKQAHLPPLYSQNIGEHLLFQTSDERRSFAFFRWSTAPKITGFFDCSLWFNLILPMGHAEKAVSHIVVGLSALHEDLEARGVPLSREDLSSRRHRFALDQYGRALSALNERRHSQDPKFKEVILTCCLLFVLFELLRGQYDLAFMHLRQGLQVIQESRKKGTAVISSVADAESLIQYMERLDTQSLFFEQDNTFFHIDTIEHFDWSHDFNDRFNTLAEARTGYDRLFANASRFTKLVNLLPPEERTFRCHPHLGERQNHLRIQREQYLAKLNRSKARFLKTNQKKTQRGIDLIDLHAKTLLIVLEFSLTGDLPPQTNAFDSVFSDIMSLSERIAHGFWEEHNNSRPTLLLDMGIIPPVMYMCSQCRDMSIRRRAIWLLETWPHREGPWDSQLIVFFLKQLAVLESEAATSDDWTDADFPQVEDAFLHVEDDQQNVVIRYRKKGDTSSNMEKWVSLDQE